MQIEFYNAKNKKIYIVAADISLLEVWKSLGKKYPNRFINVGVAEQIMIATCAGLAMRNCRPFAYTIAAFSLYRPFEMIRMTYVTKIYQSLLLEWELEQFTLILRYT